MIKISELKPFDMAEMLKTEEDIRNYLKLVIEEGDTAELLRALELVANKLNKISNNSPK